MDYAKFSVLFSGMIFADGFQQLLLMIQSFKIDAMPAWE